MGSAANLSWRSMALLQWLARVSRRQFHSEGTLEKYVSHAHADVRHISWTSPYCPPLPPIFADAAWCDMAAFLRKLGGEGRGEGAVLGRCLQRKPPHPPYRPPSPPEGKRDCVHAAKIDQNATSVNPTLQTSRCPVNHHHDVTGFELWHQRQIDPAAKYGVINLGD